MFLLAAVLPGGGGRHGQQWQPQRPDHPPGLQPDPLQVGFSGPLARLFIQIHLEAVCLL